jgi:hypothetical protein
MKVPKDVVYELCVVECSVHRHYYFRQIGWFGDPYDCCGHPGREQQQSSDGRTCPTETFCSARKTPQLTHTFFRTKLQPQKMHLT